jgi:hypothetical protein
MPILCALRNAQRFCQLALLEILRFRTNAANALSLWLSEVVYYNETVKYWSAIVNKRYKGLNRFSKHRLGNNEQFLLQVQILDEI